MQQIGLAERGRQVLPEIGAEHHAHRLVFQPAIRQIDTVGDVDLAGGRDPAAQPGVGRDVGLAVVRGAIGFKIAVGNQVHAICRGHTIGDEVLDITIAIERIITRPAVDHVGAEAANNQRAGRSHRRQRIIVGRTDNGFDGAQRIARGIATGSGLRCEVDRDTGGRGEIVHGIRAQTALQRIRARPANQRIVTGVACKRVIACATGQNVVVTVPDQRIGIVGARQVLDAVHRVGDETGRFQTANLGDQLLHLRLRQRRVEDREIIELARKDGRGAVIIAEAVVVPDQVRRQKHVAVRRADEIAANEDLQTASLIGDRDLLPGAGADKPRSRGDARRALRRLCRTVHVTAHFEIEAAIGVDGQEGEVATRCRAKLPDALGIGEVRHIDPGGNGESIRRLHTANRCIVTRTGAVEIQRLAMTGLAVDPVCGACKRDLQRARQRTCLRARAFVEAEAGDKACIGIGCRSPCRARIATGRNAGVEVCGNAGGRALPACGIIAVAAHQQVGTGTADQRVVTITTKQDVVACTAQNFVIAAAAVDRVHAAVAAEIVHVIGADDVFDAGIPGIDRGATPGHKGV